MRAWQPMTLQLTEKDLFNMPEYKSISLKVALRNKDIKSYMSHFYDLMSTSQMIADSSINKAIR